MISFLLRHRAAVALLALALTFLLALYCSGLRVDPGVEALIPTKGSDRAEMQAFQEAFGSDEVIVLALSAERLFTREGMQAIEALTARAAELPGVARVLSPANAQDLDGDDLGPFLVDYQADLASGKLTPEELGRKLAAHPLLGGLMVSSDARAAAILLQLDPEAAGQDRRRELVAQARALAARAPSWMQTYIAGMPVEKVELARSVLRDQMIFVPLVLLVIGAALALLYRRAAAVAIPLAVILISMVWTIGIYAMAGRTLNPVTALIMPVMLVTSVEGAIHVQNHYFSARARGLGRAEALQRTWKLSLTPCFNASFTTAIGFGSLLTLPIPAIRDFGMFTAMGVMLSWALTMLLMPLMLSLAPDQRGSRQLAFAPGRVEGALKRVAGAVARHPRATTIGAAVVMVVSLIGVQRIRVETDIIGSLRAASPLAQAARFIDGNLTGVNALEIMVRGADASDPDVLARIARLERGIQSLDGVRKVTSVADLYARANRAFHQGDDNEERLPEGDMAQADLRDIRDLLQERAPAEVRRFLAPDAGIARITARVTAMGTAASQSLFGAIRDLAAREGLRVSLTGDFAVLSNMSTSLVYNQIAGLIPALALILVAMAIQFRSLKLGLLVLVPSGAPVLMVYGLMGWAGIPLSVPTAMISSIAIGMTVDNTIHLMAHYRDELAASADAAGALDRMLDTSGRAIVFSVVTLSLGFFVGVFSSFLPSVHFAVLTGTTLVLGFISELVLLPLVMVSFLAAFRRRIRPAGAAALVVICMLPAPARAMAGDIVLKDQFGKQDGPAMHRGSAVMLYYGTPSDLRRMKSWELATREKAGKDACAVVRAVDARTVRAKHSESEVNQRLRNGVPDDISILVDWDGALRAAYALPDAGPSATLLDQQGHACLTLKGSVTGDAAARLAGLIAQVREKGSCP